MSNDDPETDIEYPEQSLVSLEGIHPFTKILTFRLSRIQANLNTQAADLLRRHDSVPLAHFRVLNILVNNLATTQKEITEKAEFDKGPVSYTHLTLRSASASRLGVRTKSWPAQPMASKRCSSETITRRFRMTTPELRFQVFQLSGHAIEAVEKIVQGCKLFLGEG